MCLLTTFPQPPYAVLPSLLTNHNQRQYPLSDLVKNESDDDREKGVAVIVSIVSFEFFLSRKEAGSCHLDRRMQFPDHRGACNA